MGDNYAPGDDLTADTLNERINDFIGGQYRLGGLAATSGTTEKQFAVSAATDLAADSTYVVRLYALWNGTVDNDQFFFRIRETDLTGTIVGVAGQKGFGGGPYSCVVEYVFDTTIAETNQVFSASVVRVVGTGTATMGTNSYVMIERLCDSGVIGTV